MDAATAIKLGKFGIGGLVRDSNGRVVLAFCKKVPSLYEPLTTKCITIRAGLHQALDNSLLFLEVESDSLIVVTSSSLSLSLGSIVSDIKQM